MTRQLLVTVVIASVAAVSVQPTASATDQAISKPDSTFKVRLSHQPADINTDGSVSVVGWLSCSPELYTFEYSADVSQATARGSEFLSGASLPCDSTRHRFVIRVSAYEGTFTGGAADIGIYIGLYDAANDTDLAAYDIVSTRLQEVRGPA